jgi:hypothetical protein
MNSINTLTTKKYSEKSDEIGKKIKLLEKKLLLHKNYFNKNTSNWGYIGDLSYIIEKIDEISLFLKI